VRNYFCLPFSCLSKEFATTSHLSIVLHPGSAIWQHNKTFIMFLPMQPHFILSGIYAIVPPKKQGWGKRYSEVVFWN